ncbi:LVIVD repeat-containing protein [Rhodohalobacter mucosus]|uniref:BIG2 domain-containing protein n=1 Tax=Rhodohalobacter mucosus TaxID=2079485 RepID=A0A316TUY8_9BACT|nr:hypothetical protein [Rhodohalobacter mucosus]PWN06905.1 hypothetical protein DDZ15_06425 [Rhodohalobacter mucosus]
MRKLIRSLFILIPGILAVPTLLWAQTATVTVTPAELRLDVGEKVQLTAQITDENGNPVDGEIRFFSRARRDMPVSRSGEATAMKPGSYTLFALYIDEEGNRVQQEVPVVVAYPPLDRIEITNAPEQIYTGESLRLHHKVLDEAGLTRDDVDVTFAVNNGNRAEISQFGHFRALQPGNVTVSVSAEGIETTKRITIRPNPVRSVEIGNNVLEARTGDVLHVNAVAMDGNGRPVEDARISYSFLAEPDDQLGEGATAQIDQKGRFVANKPGFYTLVAKNGNTVEQQQVRINPRNVSRDIELVGHALVANVHTSDLWIWEGVDGRDYAITGTWGGNGEAYFWEVTNPANIIPTDTVTVDARTVNDVKISEDGRLAVITREGASNRRNGIVILDVTNPRDVSVITEYTDELTGGVHNAFIYEDHVYAVNNGTRYDIINIEDPSNPYRVSRFELDTPGHSIHDVWIENGMAYSSNWSDGIVVADVGSNANALSPEGVELGLGSPSNPVELARYSYPSGWNHAAFPFKSQSTGDFYVIAGDEAFPNGLYTEDRPTIPAGWIHFIKFDDWDNPEEVASYRVPEAGTHNFWVEDDILYIAYYNGGLRVVDISGELMGDLYAQGREIAHYVTTHHEGHIPNAAMAWGPQPYKGHIFVSDWNSGLWAFKLTEEQNEEVN